MWSILPVYEFYALFYKQKKNEKCKVYYEILRGKILIVKYFTLVIK